jgi:hypothetical protein
VQPAGTRIEHQLFNTPLLLLLLMRMRLHVLLLLLLLSAAGDVKIRPGHPLNFSFSNWLLAALLGAGRNPIEHQVLQCTPLLLLLLLLMLLLLLQGTSRFVLRTSSFSAPATVCWQHFCVQAGTPIEHHFPSTSMQPCCC